MKSTSNRKIKRKTDLKNGIENAVKADHKIQFKSPSKGLSKTVSKTRLKTHSGNDNRVSESASSTIADLVRTELPHVEGLGVPGCGKSKLLVDRCRHLVEAGVPQTQILLLGFANATVNNLRDRLRHSGMADIPVATCHAWSRELIGKNLGLLDLSEMPQIVSEAQEAVLIRRAIELTRKDAIRRAEEGTTPSADVLKWLAEVDSDWGAGAVIHMFQIKRASNKKLKELVADPEFTCVAAYVSELRRMWTSYQSLKRESGNIDYSDMLQLAIRALKSEDVVLPTYQHLLVDEFQDCSPHQVHLIGTLARRIPNVMVVGDAHQAVYGFTGAHYTRLSDVVKDVQQFALSKSCRLTRETADLAMAVLPSDAGIQIDTDKGGDKPMLVTHGGLRQQTVQVADEIQDLLTSGVPPSKIAVLGRTRDSLAAVERALRAQGIATRQLGAEFDPRHAMRVAWLVHQVERTTASGATIEARQLRKRLGHIDAATPDWGRAARELAKIRSKSLEGRFQQCRAVYLRLLGGVRHCKAENVEINRWVPLCRTLAHALALKVEMERLNRSAAVTTSTIHGAKGLEWEHIFIVGVTEGLLPIYLAASDREFEEERRLLYVAITRASKQVRLYHAPVTHARTRQRFDEPSRFLSAAIGAGTIDVIKGNATRRPVAQQRRHAGNASSPVVGAQLSLM